MPRLAAYGLAVLAFCAGVVLTGTLTVGAWATTAPSPALSPSPTPVPIVVLRPCTPEMERAYEINRFALLSHIPWRDMALRGETPADAHSWEGDVLFQQWWIDHYQEVLDIIEEKCRPDPDYPHLTELPPGFGSYPPR